MNASKPRTCCFSQPRTCNTTQGWRENLGLIKYRPRRKKSHLALLTLFNLLHHQQPPTPYVSFSISPTNWRISQTHKSSNPTSPKLPCLSRLTLSPSTLRFRDFKRRLIYQIKLMRLVVFGSRFSGIQKKIDVEVCKGKILNRKAIEVSQRIECNKKGKSYNRIVIYLIFYYYDPIHVGFLFISFTGIPEFLSTILSGSSHVPELPLEMGLQLRLFASASGSPMFRVDSPRDPRIP